MNKFIEITRKDDGIKVLSNVNRILGVAVLQDETVIAMNDGSEVAISESYEKVKELIGYKDE